MQSIYMLNNGDVFVEEHIGKALNLRLYLLDLA
jgi:hypothetical protein